MSRAANHKTQNMILSGKEIAEEIQTEIKLAITRLQSPPGLAVVLVGDNPSSKTYVNMKKKACEKVGIRSFFYHLDASTTQEALIQLVCTLNRDCAIDGILVQLPLPPQIDSETILETIDPNKDVDGFHPINIGKLSLGVEGGFIPCTPLGIITLLLRAHIFMEGKEIVIVGRSNIVGKPLALLLMQNKPGLNGTVTVVHSHTANLASHTKRGDILIAAVGSPRFIKEEMVKEGAVVIDVGINREKDPEHPKGYQIVGDVDFTNVEKKCQAITPVPGGVGPLTVAMLLQNTLCSAQRKYRL